MPSRGTGTRKLSRKTDQRAALIQSLARSVILEGSVTTTRAKAKTVLPVIEKLATKARDINLHNRRQILSVLGDVEATDVLVQRMTGANRISGHLRVTREDGVRKGDGAEMATISFVDEFIEKPAVAPKKAPEKKAPKKETSNNKETK